MGNMAAGEDVDLNSRDEDETVSAVIFREGGAHAILDAARANLDDNATLFCALEALNYVCQDAKTAGKLNDAGLVDLTLDTMRQWEDDVEIVERAFDLFYTLCFAPLCAEVRRVRCGWLASLLRRTCADRPFPFPFAFPPNPPTNNLRRRSSRTTDSRSCSS
jgi:hypothetical protein